ncbi:hypothetical protein RSOL_520400 [Rhizoctonia solani AG-3 Rhs1AP]|uniref:Uncharacterized protein n=1 Tax=Rhizoctonia solani AG-3 Rhs1AP TaxID=1086054 RepID=X8JTD7_9AGAM|nr:hypothetical protein RSOL_520400 [Rhizoctonia solani AG-3 Rhs1AP]
MSHPRKNKNQTFWAYIYTIEEIIPYAQNSHLFANQPPEYAAHMLADYVYYRLKPHGPVRLYIVGYEGRKGHGMMLTLGYPNQDLDAVPLRLLRRAIRLFRARPRIVIQDGKSHWYKSPAVDENRFDKIRFEDRPERKNCSWGLAR